MIKKVFKLLLVFCAFTIQIAVAQTTVRGIITDAKDGLPLPRVNVVVKGTTIGTATDTDGKFTPEVLNDLLSLAFPFKPNHPLSLRDLTKSIKFI